MTLLRLLLFLCLITPVTDVLGTHLVGGFASYEYIGRVGNTNNFRYRIFFKVYRDCNPNVRVGFDDFIDVCIYENNSSGNMFLVQRESIQLGPIRKVQPIGFSNCPIDTSACIEETVYERVITLPQSNLGFTLKWERCCRNRQVNLPNRVFQGVFQPSEGQTFITKIPPTSIVNSSPYFSETPVPFVCVNDTTAIRNYAIDPDGDSLVYRLSAPFHGGSLGDAIPSCNTIYQGPQEVTYAAGYNASQPFGQNGIAQIDPSTGTLTVLARITGNYALAVDVEEWRNGVLLSVVRLDIQLLVINCPPNDPPFLTTDSRIFNREVLAGQEICFDITAVDPESQNVRIRGIGQLFTGGLGWVGPTATLPSRTAKQRVTSTFCWKTICDQARNAPYSFVLEAIDDGCPAKFINLTYNIFVRGFISNATISGKQIVCMNENAISYKASNTVNNSQLLWTVENGTIIFGQGTDSIVVSWDFSQTQGKVTLKEISGGGCDGKEIEYVVNFVPSPPNPEILGPDSICLSNIGQYNSSIPNMNYFWMLPDFSTRNTRNIQFQGLALGQYTLKHNITNNLGCPSDTSFKTVTVVKANAGPIIGPETVCPNNGNIEFFVQGPASSTYIWIADGATIQNGQGTPNVTLAFGEPAILTLKVIEINSLGCIGDTLYHLINVTYDLIIKEPTGPLEICEFSERIPYIPVPKVNNTVYFWSVSGGQIQEIDSQYHLYVNWGAAGNGQISYFQTAFDTLNSKQCVSNTVQIPVVLHPYPIANVIEGIFETCQFSTPLQFTINGYPNSSFLWRVNNNENLTGQGTNSISYPTQQHGTFRLWVRETSDFGCIGEPVDTAFTIHPKPVTSPISGPNVLCFPQFNNIRYEVSGFDQSTYRWFFSENAFNDSSRTRQAIVSWTGSRNNGVRVLETSSFGCPGDTISLPVFIDSIGIDIKVATVTPPPSPANGLSVYWDLIGGERYDTTFQIFKRNVAENGDFISIGVVNGNIFEFTENQVNTNLTPFDFKVTGYNLCRELITSPIHTTVLLQGRKPETYTVEMSHSPYLGWWDNVANYELHRLLLNRGGFLPYDNNPSPVRYYYENGLEHYSQCYRVKSYENNGREEVSWSNEICFNYPPVIFVPNAFSPNGNLTNDRFMASTGAIKSFKMKVFNRWGEKLFETDNVNDSWDGTFAGIECPQGVYVFMIDFTDYADNPYQKKGTVHLLR